MISKDNEQIYINFCRKFLLRAMKNSKQRYLRNERRKRKECILNSKNESEDELVDSIVGNSDVNFDDIFELIETIENENLYLAYKKLSKQEADIVEYRIKGYPYKEINRILNFKRRNTSIEIYNRAINKMRNFILENINKEMR